MQKEIRDDYSLVRSKKECFSGAQSFDDLASHGISLMNNDMAGSMMQWISAVKSINPKVLFVGCGDGNSCKVIKDIGAVIDYHGCDISDVGIDVARRMHGAIGTFKVSDATSLQYDDGEFDVVLLESCLHYIKDYDVAVREACRVSRKAVIVFFTQTHSGNENMYYVRSLRRFGSNGSLSEITFSESLLYKSFLRNEYLLFGGNLHSVRYLAGPAHSVITSYSRSLLLVKP